MHEPCLSRIVTGLEGPVKERIVLLFIADRRGGSVSRVDSRVFGENKEFPADRIEDRFHISPEEVGPSDRAGKQRIPYEYRSVEKDAYSALRMPRCVQHLSGLSAELDRVARLEIPGYRDILGRPEAPRGASATDISRVSRSSPCITTSIPYSAASAAADAM